MTNEHSSPAAETYSFPVVILGGGFAGAYCARAVTAGLRDAATESVALLADQNAMLFHPMLAEVSGSSISPLHVVNPLRRFCRGSSIFMGAVEEIDLNGQTVRFSPGPFVHAASLKFEHLVLAIGNVVDVSRVPGMPEHGYLMKTVGDAIQLRADVIQRLEEASVTTTAAVRRRLLAFVVVGGGYSGVETAGQIYDLLRDVRNFYPRLDRKDFRLVLVHSGPYLLPQIGEELGRYCGNQLEKRGIEVRLDTRVTAITAERAILSTGDVIEANTVVTTVGNATHPVIKKLIDRYQLANAKGRLVTEPTLQVRGHEKLWAAGDCAAVPLPDGSISPATAQFAIRQGTVLGKNIDALRSKRPLQPFGFKALGEMASLGHLNAVGKVFGFKVSGLLGWMMWRAVYLSKLPGLERKLKVFFEWTLELLFPRDISLLDIKMTEVIYPPDNDCLRRSNSWRAAPFTGRSRRATALVATRAAAVTLKAPSTDRTYTSATAERVERPPATMCPKPRRATCVAPWRPGANSKPSCGSSPCSTKSARLKPLASKNRCSFETGFS